MDRGKMPSAGRGAKSKAPQHPQDIFALGSKSTVVVSRDPEKRNIHKPSTSGVERKREPSGFGSQPPSKRARIGSPAEAVGGTSLEVDPVDLVPNVLQALDTHNSDKLLGLLTGSIRLLKSQRSKPDPILCMGLLYLTKIRPNMFAHETVTQSLCTLLKREQGAAFKNKGNPLVYILACNMLYAGHRESNNWPDIFIKVYIEDALNERCWVECSWCKCFVENVVTAFSTKQPPSHLIPTDNTLGTMSPSGSGSPLMGSTEEDPDNMELEYSVYPSPIITNLPQIRMISASRLEAWLHSGKLWRCAQELLAYVCCNCDACGPTAARDHEVLAQLARMRLKTKPLQAAYQACLSVVTHTIYNELSNVRSPNNMAVLAALIQAQPQQVPAAMADTYQELVLRPEDYLRPLGALTREVVRAARADAAALLPLARALAQPPPHEPPNEVRERAFSSLADLFCCCCLVTASHSKHLPEYRQQICVIQASALGWLLDTAMPLYRPSRHDYQLALNKLMFVEPAETYSKVDNWPPESERAATYRLCCEAPLPQNTLLRVIFIGLSKVSQFLNLFEPCDVSQDIPVSPAEVFELVEHKPSIEWSSSSTAEAERAESERAAILQLESHLAAASNAKLPVNEHNSRLLSQLTTLEPLGPARKPPQAIIETLQAMSSQMRLGKLLCRQPALLLDLVERHGTRRAMPWLHQLLRHDQLELSVLPVQCLCEFLSAGGAGGAGGEVGKAGELCAHLRRTVADSEEGARAVLHYYMARLAHTHAPTRASANRVKIEISVQPPYLSSPGPEPDDTNQEMYSWLMSVWVGSEAPVAYTAAGAEACLLPDWLRLHMVRSARPPLLEAGMRALPAPKLALFIQTFGMPVPAMSALLSALDACPMGALSRLGVERAYMAQLLSVQRARGATGGHAFAATLRLTPLAYPPDDMLFVKEELPMEAEDEWGNCVVPTPLQPDLCKLLAGPVVAVLRAMMHSGALAPDLDLHLPQHANKEQLIAALEAATPSTLEALGNRIISSQDPRVIVDVITHILEKNQDGHYESKLGEMVRLVAAEARQTEAERGGDAARRRADARLALLLRAAPAPPLLLALAAAARDQHPLLLLLLYMKVPLTLTASHIPGGEPPLGSPEDSATAAAVGRAQPTAVAAGDEPRAAQRGRQLHQRHRQESNNLFVCRLWRMEAEVRGMWARVGGAGSRALGLAAALLRGAGPHLRHHSHILAALEVLPEQELFAASNAADVHSILSASWRWRARSPPPARCCTAWPPCYAGTSPAGPRPPPRCCTSIGTPSRQYTPLPNASYYTNIRYCASHVNLLDTIELQSPSRNNEFVTIIFNTPALASLQAADVSAPASAAPPPLALQALQRRYDTPDNLHWLLQEIEAWGSRRGGAWGGAGWAAQVLRCAAPHAAAAHAPLRNTALALLAKLLPAVTDTTPGLQAVLECLDSHQPEVTQSLLDKLPELLVGMQEHAAKILMRVFELGLKSRHPVEPCIAKCVTTINLHRGC
ncbi:hypothetical protein HF086_009656 [Spodoptera exigua]|uniref:Integrator complex subunit 1 n=1 Tax=Spodoptera exigua TaxID=7107 RepID=A0A922MTW6_SPOEX|nr:hypothetical protein HF086_009656 [Spodoptera exigua]